MGSVPSIDVSMPGRSFAPGRPITLRIAVAAEAGVPLRAVRIELGYDNAFLYQDDSIRRPGLHRRGNCAVAVEAKEMLGDHPLLAGGSGTFDTTLQLPDDAPASVPDWVQWRVRAMLLYDARGHDQVATVPITVLATPDRYDAWAREVPLEIARNDMRLELTSRLACVGETLHGTLHVDAGEPFDAQAVRVELRCRMNHRDSISKVLAARTVMEAPAAAFVPGVPQQFSFELSVPEDGVPSTRAPYNDVRWSVWGVCDRVRRSDHTVDAELVVYNAPSDGGRPADPGG
jgi:hypothetical protein